MSGDRILKCFSNGNDWVIAYNEEDAWNIWCKTMGEDRDDYRDYSWEEVSGDTVLTCYDENSSDTELAKSKTASAWVAECGRGFFMSLDF